MSPTREKRRAGVGWVVEVPQLVRGDTDNQLPSHRWQTHVLKFPSKKLLKMNNTVTPPVKPILWIWDVPFLGEAELAKSQM